MQSESLWLGPLRRPVFLAFCAAAICCAAVFVILISLHFFAAEPITMMDMLRPDGKFLALAMLWSLFATIILGAVLMSDILGRTEEPKESVFDIVSLVVSRLGLIGIVAIVVVMFYEVIARYVFAGGTLWANELSLWIAGFLFLFAGLYAMQQRSHIRIYVIYDMMPRWMQKASDVFSVLLIWGFTICLIWGGYNEAKTKILRMETFGTAWDSPLPSTIKLAILVVVAMVAVQALFNLIVDWNKAPEHFSPADEIDQNDIDDLRRTLNEK